MPLSFAVDIRQLFRDAPDIEAMKRYGLDVSSYEQVKEKAPEIYATFEDGSMRCDGTGRRITWRCSNAGWTKAWPPELISAGQGLKIVHDSFCAYRLKPTLRKNQTGWLAQS